MKKSTRVLSVILSIVLFTAHINALTAQAAPLDAKDAGIITNAISQTEQLKKSPKKDYFTTMSDGRTRFVKSLAITNLAMPKNGSLLDEAATVVTDDGYSWDIPVIWVNKDGDIIHVAIEIDDIVKSYPVFVFYMPEGCTLVLGENTGYDIQMPDFVVDMMRNNGVTTLSMPEGGVTYISAVLPEVTGFKLNVPDSSVDEAASETEVETRKHSDSDEHYNEPDPVNPDPEKPADPEPVNPEPDPEPEPSEPYLTPATDNDSTPPATNLTDEENQQLVEAHCDENVINKIGVDKLAALVNWVKNTLEPEAANLLTSKFPAFKEAAMKGELGKDLGLYVYYDTYYDEDGKTQEKSRSLASVDVLSDSSGSIRYRLSVNAGGFYEQNPETGEYEFNADDAYSNLDNTLIHEMMHAFMSDYTRTGMTGWEYDKSDGTYDLAAEDELKYPKWFSEGVASTVENMFQYWRDEYYQYYNDDKKTVFSEAVMKQSYKNNPEHKLNGSDVESDYITGYLACMYLSYMRAKQYNKEAITGSLEKGNLRVDSSVILGGLNSILEDLHNGKTLDEIIASASKVNGKSLYKDTQDFESKFIINDTTDEQSVKFCTNLLNYLHQSSTDKKTANGSLLIDFADTNKTQLNKGLLKNKQKAYAITDDSEYASSTVNKKAALKSGGTSGDGITGSSTSSQIAKISNDQVESEQAAKIRNIKDDAADDSDTSGVAERIETNKTASELLFAEDSEKTQDTDSASKDEQTSEDTSVNAESDDKGNSVKEIDDSVDEVSDDSGVSFDYNLIPDDDLAAGFTWEETDAVPEKNDDQALAITGDETKDTSEGAGGLTAKETSDQTSEVSDEATEENNDQQAEDSKDATDASDDALASGDTSETTEDMGESSGTTETVENEDDHNDESTEEISDDDADAKETADEDSEVNDETADEDSEVNDETADEDSEVNDETDDETSGTDEQAPEETAQAVETSTSDVKSSSETTETSEAVEEATEEAHEEAAEEAHEEAAEETHEEAAEETHEEAAEETYEETHEETTVETPVDASEEDGDKDETVEESSESAESSESVSEDAQSSGDDEVVEEASESSESSEESTPSDESTGGNEDSSEPSGSDESLDESTQEEASVDSEPEESYEESSEEPAENPIIISETEDEPEDQGSDDVDEQVLDAMPEDDTEESED